MRRENQRDRFFPLILLLIAGIAYALLSPWLGFYWDDWPKALFIDSIGPEAFSKFAAHRPLNGKWYILFSSLLGTRPFAWQILALLFRSASAIAFWALLKNIWPKAKDFAQWSAILFLLYPGFTQQNIALSYYIHFLAYTAILLSFYFTAKALNSSRQSFFLHAIALSLSLINMLTTDYFYGLELIRPIIILIVIWQSNKSPTQNTGKMLKIWSPYLLLVLALFAWRSTLQAPESYEISIFDTLLTNSGAPALSQIGNMLADVWDASIVAWLSMLKLFSQITLFSKISWLSLVILITTGLGTFLLFKSTKDNETQKSSSRSKFLLAIAALFLANIPVWASGLEPNLQFPANRLNLPMAIGAAMLLVSLIMAIIRSRSRQLLIVAALIALASAFHFQVANTYREDYERLASFQQQLTWRAPALLPHTALLTQELPFSYMSDDSLTGAINLVYPSPEPESSLNNALFYLELRLGSKIPALETEQDIYWNYRLIDFNGNTSQSIVLYYAPPACLRILDPLYDHSFPLLPQALRQALPLSDVSRIDSSLGIAVNTPAQFFPSGDKNSWCYYFQQADVARQNADWERVAEIGDIAFALDDSPNHASERIPFIEAYARTGNWPEALALSQEALQINKFMDAMLCETWERIDSSTDNSTEKQQAFAELSAQLACLQEQ